MKEKKRIKKNKIQFLNSQSDDISNLLEISLEKMDYNSEKITRYTMLVEEALLRWKECLPKDAEISFESKRKYNNVVFYFKIKGEKVNPFFTANNDENPFDKMVDNLFAGVGNEIKYKYKNGVNCIILNLPITKNYEKVIFRRNLFIVMMPIIMQQLFSTIATNVDVFMLGFYNTISMSGVSLVSSFAQIPTQAYLGTSLAGVSILSQLFGKNDRKKINIVSSFILRILACFAILFFAVSLIASKKILGLYTNDEALISEGAKYLKIVAFSFLIEGGYRLMYCIIQGMGHVKVIFKISLIGCIVNISINSILIFGLFGLPRLGVVGASIGTVINSLIQFVLSTIFVIKRSKVKLFTLEKDKAIIKKSFSLIIVSIFQHVIFYLASNIIVSGYGHLGSDVVAAYSLLNIVSNIAISFTSGFSVSCAIWIGRLLGRNKFIEAKQRSQEALRLVLLFGLIFAPFYVLICYLLRFMPIELSDASINYMNIMIIVASINLITCFYNSVAVSGVLLVGGDTISVLLIDTIVVWIAIIPIALLSINNLITLPFWVLFIILGSNETITMPFKFIQYKKYKWLKNLT